MLITAPLLAALLVANVTVEQVPNPRTRGAWVTDMVGTLGPGATARLEAMAAEIERTTGVEIPVVVVADVPGTPREFATELFNRWGVGKAAADNGVLVLLVMGQRRLEMETGYGLEGVLPDGWLGTMQQQHMVPRFKAADFGGGMVAGMEQLRARILEHADEAREGSRNKGVTHAAKRMVRRHGEVLRVGGSSLGLVGLAAGAVLWTRRRRRLERTCDECGGEMRLLPESEEDKHLTRSQQLEEKLGSILYDVFVCEPCTFTRVVPRNKWFSGYGRCSSCSNKTMSSTSNTLRRATYDHGGLVEITETCRFCKAVKRYTRATPRLQRSTSTGSSGYRSGGGGGGGGGSFGGGRSGGGGAGSSW